MLTIYLARHGETIENQNKLLQGITPGHLSERGKQQAKELALKLEHEYFDVIISSPLQRAVDTTKYIQELGHEETELELNELLMERDWGSLTLWPYDKARALETFPDDVETLEHGIERARIFLNEVFQKYDGKKILAMGHGFINRCIISIVYSKSKSEIKRMENAEFRVIELHNEIKPLENSNLFRDEASAN